MSDFQQSEIKELLEELHDRYNRIEFIENDPISIPHSFSDKGDIEIAGFFAATLAWGKRSQIIKNAKLLMELMEYSPHEFVVHATEKDLKRLNKFYYRTFQSADALFFVEALRDIYNQGGLEKIFVDEWKNNKSIKSGLVSLFTKFHSVKHEQRSMKHLANVQKGSSAKRLNMFLRWMVRNDNRGVDFGLWNKIPSSALYIPIDVHSGRVARELNLLKRKQNDWKAVEELTESLKFICPEDPVKYDFSLFGFGVNHS